MNFHLKPTYIQINQNQPEFFFNITQLCDTLHIKYRLLFKMMTSVE